MADGASYTITIRARSGREYTSRPIELTAAQAEQVQARMHSRQQPFEHALATVIHEVLTIAVRGDELITIGPCQDRPGNTAVSGREVEAVSVEVHL